MRYELNMEWTQARINEAAERGDMEQVQILADNYFARRRENAIHDCLDAYCAAIIRDRAARVKTER